MNSSSSMHEPEDQRDDVRDASPAWWGRSFDARRAALEAAYGVSHRRGGPAGSAFSFTWDDVSIRGGGCLACPPAAGRGTWAYVSLGLTQPLDAAEARELRQGDARQARGYAFEVAMLLPVPEEWPARILRQLMWYVRKHRPINPGDRMPFGVEREPGGGRDANIGDQEAVGAVLEGPMRHLLFWPRLDRPRSPLTDEAGAFGVLIATAITGPEFEFARATSGEHLLLLLWRSGVGQRSDLSREDVVLSHRWGEDVRLVRSMSWSEAAGTLGAIEAGGEGSE